MVTMPMTIWVGINYRRRDPIDAARIAVIIAGRHCSLTMDQQMKIGT